MFINCIVPIKTYTIFMCICLALYITYNFFACNQIHKRLNRYKRERKKN